MLLSRFPTRSNLLKPSFTSSHTIFRHRITPTLPHVILSKHNMSSASFTPVEFLPTGAIIQSFKVGGTDIVLGFPSESAYTKTGNPPFFGTSASFSTYAVPTELTKRTRRDDRESRQPDQQRQNRLLEQRQVLPARSQREGKDKPTWWKQRMGQAEVVGA